MGNLASVLTMIRLDFCMVQDIYIVYVPALRLGVQHKCSPSKATLCQLYGMFSLARSLAIAVVIGNAIVIWTWEVAGNRKYCAVKADTVRSKPMGRNLPRRLSVSVPCPSPCSNVSIVSLVCIHPRAPYVLIVQLVCPHTIEPAGWKNVERCAHLF